MQLIGPCKKPGPPVLAIQQLAPAGSDRFVDSPLTQPLLMFRIGGPPFGPPLLPRQISYAEGSDRFIDAPLTHPLLKFRIGSRPFGPPLLGQLAYAEGSDRYLDSPLPGNQRLMLVGAGNRIGPPILVRQQTFSAEGNDRYVDAPLVHPLLKFQIGSRLMGPPLVVRQVGYAEGNDRFVDSPITHPLVRFRIGSRGWAGPPIIQANQWLCSGSSFPIQYAGLRTFYSGAVKELCLVAETDAPAGMGGVIKILKGGIKYCVFLVETSDPNASSVRVMTTSGTKSIRLKT